MSRIQCFLVEDSGKTYSFPILGEDGKRDRTGEGPVYVRPDTGEEFNGLSCVPVGAMWFADWYDDCIWKPQLKHCLVVKTPGGDWVIDSQAANCNIQDDFRQERHHCWVIQGEFPHITVGKAGAPTCQDGAGSIAIGSYHGFLRNGYLEEC